MPSLHISFLKHLSLLQMKKFSLALYVLAFGIIINSCNDPSPIGSELLQEDQVDIFFTDSITLVASTLKEDRILTYDPNPSTINDNFLLGDYTDPVFGTVNTGIYAQLTLDFNPPDYEGALVDSVVLTLQYDSLGTYGQLDQDLFSLGIYRVTENIDRESDYFSDDSFIVDEANPLAEVLDFSPKVSSMDSLQDIIDYRFNSDGDTISIPPSLRIRFSNFFGGELVNYDSVIYANNTSFLEQFNGIHVRPLAQTPGMLSFDISSLSASGMTVYYRQDTINTQYEYSFSSRFVQFNSFEHDFQNTTIDNFFDDTTLGDSLLFLQAMSGPNIKIELPNIDDLQNIIVNKAELEFTVASDVDGDNLNNYPPIETMIAADIGDDGEFVFLSDVLVGNNGSFGGFLIDEVGEQGEAIQVYRMNISAHFQQIIDGLRDNTIYLRAFPKQEQAGRVVIYGPGHSTYPMKLKLTYTNLN